MPWRQCGPADAALVQAVGHDDNAEHLADLLSDHLGPVHDTDLHSLIHALERVLAVLTVDLPAARALATASR